MDTRETDRIVECQTKRFVNLHSELDKKMFECLKKLSHLFTTLSAIKEIFLQVRDNGEQGAACRICGGVNPIGAGDALSDGG